MPYSAQEERRQRLLEWFQDRRRDLPWRRERTVYATWISEIMLQQTTVATVIPYFERFLAAFPDVRSLAAAPEEEVLALWTGLGYYRRARHLHRAARLIVHEHDGAFPGDAETWRRLPGVGEYTAGAIASQALGQRVPAVDANARRVLCRWSFDDPEAAGRLAPRQLQRLAVEMVPARDPGAWNEALMELGAVICTARRPACGQCPVLDHCAAGLAGSAAEIPPPRRREKAVPVTLAILVMRHGDRVLLTRPDSARLLPVKGDPALAREDTASLHQGLFGLPGTPWYALDAEGAPDLTDPALIREGLPALLEIESPLAEAVSLVDRGRFVHAITRYRLEVRVWAVFWPADQPAPTPAETVWTADPASHPLSHLVTKSLALIGSE